MNNSEHRLIKVAIITTSFPLSLDSVSGIFVCRLVEAFPVYVKATVITPCPDHDISSSFIGSNQYKVICFRYAPRKWQILAHKPGGIPVSLQRSSLARWVLLPFLIAQFFACWKAAKHADILHANWSINGVLAGLVSRLVCIPLLTTLRGEDVTRAKHSLIYRYILFGSLYLSRKIVAVSEAIAEGVKEIFPKYADKIVVVPNGVDKQFLNIAALELPENQSQPLNLLVIASLIPRKGIDTILAAIDHLPLSVIFQLKIIGGGGLRAELEKQADALKFSERVIFLGEIAPQDIATQLQEADILILASYSEGRPNVILEAMASGRAVVASDIDGVRELITEGKTGLLFPPGDAVRLSSQLLKLWNNPHERINLGNAAKRFIIDNGLLWSKTSKCYENLYKQILNE